MLIRPAIPDDAAAIAALRERTIRTVVAPLGLYTPAEIDAWASDYSAGRVRDFIAQGNFFVAEGDRLHGYGRLHFDARGPTLLKGIFVDADSIGRGTGSAIVRHLLARGHALGATTFELFATLNARRFYERHGFEALSVVRHGTPNGAVIPSVHMRRQALSPPRAHESP